MDGLRLLLDLCTNAPEMYNKYKSDIDRLIRGNVDLGQYPINNPNINNLYYVWGILIGPNNRLVFVTGATRRLDAQKWTLRGQDGILDPIRDGKMVTAYYQDFRL
jgi:hypothetical protein